MKTIPMKAIPMQLNGKEIQLSYKDQLIEIIRNPDPNKPLNYGEVRSSIRVLDALEAADGTLKIEDADYAYMKQRVLDARWPVADKAIETFVEDVTGA